MNPAIHLITGQTGAGKTTYAQMLAERENAMRFSIDEWMTTLFWMDSPHPIVFEWTMQRIERCEDQIRKQTAALLILDVPVVLDLGFTKRDHRVGFAGWAARRGADVNLHWVDIPREERWARVQRRNIERGSTFTMKVDRTLFEFMEGQWEEPQADEAPHRVEDFW